MFPMLQFKFLNLRIATMTDVIEGPSDLSKEVCKHKLQSKKIYTEEFASSKIFCDLKGYLHYKTIASQNVSSEAQVTIFFFFFAEKLCPILKIFKFLYF